MTVQTTAKDATYTWIHDGTQVAITATPMLTFESMQASDAGIWNVDVSVPCGQHAQSMYTNLTVLQAPIVTQQPLPMNVCQGRDATLSVSALGDDVRYQWKKDGVDIEDATQSSFTIFNAGPATNGLYACMVSGTCAPAVTTEPVTVTAIVPPVIVTDLTDQVVCQGSPVTLSVTATGYDLDYTWFKNGVVIPFADAPTLMIPAFSTSDVGQYQCVVRYEGLNDAGCDLTARSAVVTVSHFSAPRIVSQSHAVDGCMNGSADLWVRAEGFDMHYQWYRNGVVIPEATMNAYQVRDLTSSMSGVYTVRISGSCDLQVVSDPIVLKVIQQPTLVSGPNDAELTVGEELSLTALGTDVRSVQWYKNNIAIPSATYSTLTVPHVTTSNAGVYSAVLMNDCGAVSTRYAVVHVTDPTMNLPELTVAQLNVDAGDVPVTYARTIMLTSFFTNTGRAPLTITRCSITSPAGSGTFTISQGDEMPITLAPGETHSIGISFYAPAVGASAADLRIVSNTPSGDMVVGLSGRGVLRYTVPVSVAFQHVVVNTSAMNCINVVNTSTMAVTIDDATFSGVDQTLFSIESALPVTIGAGATDQLCIRFAPTSVGQKSARLTVRSTDGGNTEISLFGDVDRSSDVITHASVTEVQAYPNPSHGAFTFTGTLLVQGTEITVLNAVGETVAALVCTDDRPILQWNDGTVANGTYTVIVRNRDTLRTLSITVLR